MIPLDGKQGLAINYDTTNLLKFKLWFLIIYSKINSIIKQVSCIRKLLFTFNRVFNISMYVLIKCLKGSFKILPGRAQVDVSWIGRARNKIVQLAVFHHSDVRIVPKQLGMQFVGHLQCEVVIPGRQHCDISLHLAEAPHELPQPASHHFQLLVPPCAQLFLLVTFASFFLLTRGYKDIPLGGALWLAVVPHRVEGFDFCVEGSVELVSTSQVQLLHVWTTKLSMGLGCFEYLQGWKGWCW